MIYFTHDIDWLNPWHWMSIAKAFSGKKWLSIEQLLKRDVFLQSIENTIQLNRSNNIEAIFLFGIQKSINTINKGALRYAYNTALVKELIEMFKHYNVTIGIHVNQLESINFQLTQFELLAGTKPQYMRTHYFGSLDKSALQEIYKYGVTTDFSGGNTTYVGYTAPRSDNPMKQVCTLLSDNNFVRLKNEAKVWPLFEQCLNDERVRINGGAILFHPENFLIYPDFIQKYLSVIGLVKQSGLPYFQQNQL